MVGQQPGQPAPHPLGEVEAVGEVVLGAHAAAVLVVVAGDGRHHPTHVHQHQLAVAVETLLLAIKLMCLAATVANGNMGELTTREADHSALVDSSNAAINLESLTSTALALDVPTWGKPSTCATGTRVSASGTRLPSSC